MLPDSDHVDVSPRSRPSSSHHRRRSSVSTRRESAEMMGVPLPPEDENEHPADADIVRSRALHALEGKTVVEIPEWQSPDKEPDWRKSFVKSAAPSFSVSNPLLGKRDSFGKLLTSSSANNKIDLQTLHEEDEEDDESPEQEVCATPLPSTRIRPVLRPLSLSQPPPRVALKALTLNAPLSTTPTSTSFPRSLILTPTTPPELKPSIPSFSSSNAPRRSTNLAYRRSSGSQRFTASSPSSIASQMLPSPMASTPSSDFSEDNSADEPGPLPVTVSPTLPVLPHGAYSRPLSPSESIFLYQSHAALLNRISELEAALASRSSSVVPPRPREASTLPTGVPNTPPPPPSTLTEFLLLISDLKSERDDLTREVSTWRARCADLEKQVAVLVRRVETERREGWVVRERLGVTDVEKEGLEREVNRLQAEIARLRTELQDALKDRESREVAAPDPPETSLRTPVSGDWQRDKEKERMLKFSFGGAKSPSPLSSPITPVSNREARRSSLDSQSTTIVNESRPSSSTVVVKDGGFRFPSSNSLDALRMKLQALDAEERSPLALAAPQIPGMSDEEELQQEDEEDELAHYEDEAESDVPFDDDASASSSFSTPSRHLSDPQISDELVAEILEPSRMPSLDLDLSDNNGRSRPGSIGSFPSRAPLSPTSRFSPVTPTLTRSPSTPRPRAHGRTSSLSMTWTFPTPTSISATRANAKKEDVDKFFGCLEDVDSGGSSGMSEDDGQSLPRIVASNFGFGATLDEDGDDLPPFVVPALATEEQATLLPPDAVFSDEEDNDADESEGGELAPEIDFTPCNKSGRPKRVNRMGGVQLPRLVLTRSSVVDAAIETDGDSDRLPGPMMEEDIEVVDDYTGSANIDLSNDGRIDDSDTDESPSDSCDDGVVQLASIVSVSLPKAASTTLSTQVSDRVESLSQPVISTEALISFELDDSCPPAVPPSTPLPPPSYSVKTPTEALRFRFPILGSGKSTAVSTRESQTPSPDATIALTSQPDEARPSPMPIPDFIMDKIKARQTSANGGADAPKVGRVGGKWPFQTFRKPVPRVDDEATSTPESCRQADKKRHRASASLSAVLGAAHGRTSSLLRLRPKAVNAESEARTSSESPIDMPLHAQQNQDETNEAQSRSGSSTPMDAALPADIGADVSGTEGQEATLPPLRFASFDFEPIKSAELSPRATRRRSATVGSPVIPDSSDTSEATPVPRKRRLKLTISTSAAQATAAADLPALSTPTSPLARFTLHNFASLMPWTPRTPTASVNTGELTTPKTPAAPNLASEDEPGRRSGSFRRVLGFGKGVPVDSNSSMRGPRASVRPADISSASSSPATASNSSGIAGVGRGRALSEVSPTKKNSGSGMSPRWRREPRGMISGGGTTEKRQRKIRLLGLGKQGDTPDKDLVAPFSSGLAASSSSSSAGGLSTSPSGLSALTSISSATSMSCQDDTEICERCGGCKDSVIA